MNVVLPPELARYVTNQVQTGRYLDESDVVRDALRSLARLERDEDAVLEVALLEGVRASHEDYDEGVLDSVRQRGRSLAASA